MARSTIRAAVGALLVTLCLAPAAPARELGRPGGAGVREEAHSIPVVDDDRHIVRLAARICRPPGDARARLVVINHGSPANAADRPSMRLGRCDSEAAEWFVSRGYVVAFALRRGYGETGGGWAENIGKCEHPDYVRAGLETARDIDAVVAYATALPYVQDTGVIVVGQSAGGWGTIAYAALPHPRVSAFVVMAGGRGGHKDNEPNRNCRPDQLAAAAGRFGASARTPMLWIYTANDSFFGPEIARALWQAFTAAGGTADLEQLGPFDGDGHRLFFGRGGSAVWGPRVAKYLQATAAN
jgi:dienelactone hydrolase